MTTEGQYPAGTANPANSHPECPASPEDLDRLAMSLARLRDAIAGARYPLPVPTAGLAQTAAAATVAQIEDYLLPRIANLGAPLLVVVGGSTGAGKSTLVNSLVRAPISPSGVLRPTTRAPVLACHPADGPWFSAAALLPELTRVTHNNDDPNTLQIVSALALSPGLALLDSPDIDSVVEANRKLAGRLLAAADLWLFVTTAARYADAVPWQLLQVARARGAAVALVLDRVPNGAAREVVPHLTNALSSNHFAGVPLFVVPEARLDGQRLLMEETVASLRDWLASLAADATTRAAIVGHGVAGAVDALAPVVGELARAARDQGAAITALDSAVRSAYRAADSTVERGLADIVGSPGYSNGQQVDEAITALLHSVAIDAAEQTATAWRTHPAGEAMVTRIPALAAPARDLASQINKLIVDWRFATGAAVDIETDGPYETGSPSPETAGPVPRQAVSALLEAARTMLDRQAQRYRDALDGVGVDPAAADTLLAAADAVAAARAASGLPAGRSPISMVRAAAPPAAPPAAGVHQRQPQQLDRSDRNQQDRNQSDRDMQGQDQQGQDQPDHGQPDREPANGAGEIPVPRQSCWTDDEPDSCTTDAGAGAGAASAEVGE